MSKFNKIYEKISPSFRDFIFQWKKFGFKIAVNNHLLILVTKLIDADRVTITYHKRKKG